jgi:hypothetical protein
MFILSMEFVFCCSKAGYCQHKTRCHGISQQTDRFVRTGRDFPEGLIEAWANLYTEFAVAVVARRDQIELPDPYLRYPKIDEGIEGVRFVDACVRSNESKGWVEL